MRTSSVTAKERLQVNEVLEAVIKFGTDGWRGAIAEDYTFDNVRRCAQGFARFLLERQGAEKGAVVGYDKRFNSEYFAAAASDGCRGYWLAVRQPSPKSTTSAILHSRR